MVTNDYVDFPNSFLFLYKTKQVIIESAVGFVIICHILVSANIISFCYKIKIYKKINPFDFIVKS